MTKVQSSAKQQAPPGSHWYKKYNEVPWTKRPETRKTPRLQYHL